jgi:hypothetical protein
MCRFSDTGMTRLSTLLPRPASADARPGVLLRFALENGRLAVHTQYAPKPEKFSRDA